MPGKLDILDTTLRDGAQGRGISFSIEDKRNIAYALDSLGIGLIELGNPIASPREADGFSQLCKLPLTQAKLCAFGSTRRHNLRAEEDPALQQLIHSGASHVVLFGKAWLLHVREVLGTTADENLRMIADSIECCKKHGLHVIFDAEHYFDGAHEDAGYVRAVLEAAQSGGADCLTLCDTNGAASPDVIYSLTEDAVGAFRAQIGIHCHDDCGLAVASSMMAVRAGATHIQGTLLGFGERCGNANLSTLIPNLQLKFGYRCIPDDCMAKLTYTAARVAEISNITLNKNLPYVGSNAFAHKAGMHADGVFKNQRSFEHVDPALVGNYRRVVTSEMAGRSAILPKLQQLRPGLTKDSPETAVILEQMKAREQYGYTYEGAEASFELLVRRTIGLFRPHFKLLFYRSQGEYPRHELNPATAVVKIRVGDKETLEAGEGNGPVNALDVALRRALATFYPNIREAFLRDFKVRVLDPEAATAANVRVLMTTTDGKRSWSTIGVASDVLEASCIALTDSIEYKLMLDEQDGIAILSNESEKER